MGRSEGKAAPRPDALNNTPAYSAQGNVAMGAMGVAGLKAAIGGKSMMGAAFNSPVAQVAQFANPRGRIAQVAADRSYLGVDKRNPMSTARTADYQAGLPAIMKASAGAAWLKGARIARLPDQVQAALIGAPVLVGSYAALDAGYRGARNVMNWAAEGGRFDRAMAGLDPSDFGDPSFEDRFRSDPEGMTGALRDTFGMINRVAPSVARDPILAREYMRRLLMDPQYRQPPEEYVRQVDALSSLENRLQGSRASLLDGATLGNVALAPIKASGVGVDVHGYYRSHVDEENNARRDALEQVMSDAAGNPPREPAGEGGWKDPEYRRALGAWMAIRRQVEESSPDVLEPYQYLRKSRIQTPYDRETSMATKVHRFVLGDAGEKYTTDEVYDGGDINRLLTKRDLRDVLSLYRANLRALPSGELAGDERAAAKAFLQKGKALLRDPRLQYARVEYE